MNYYFIYTNRARFMSLVNYNSEKQRKDIIVNQLIPFDVTDEKILQLVSKIPRSLFIPDSMHGISNCDSYIPYADNRFLLNMGSMARILEVSSFNPSDVVLILNSGSGYSTSLICNLVSQVVCMEEDISLAKQSGLILKKLNINNYKFSDTDISKLNIEETINKVFIEGAISEIPAEVLNLLKSNNKIELIGVFRENNLSKIIKAKFVDNKLSIMFDKSISLPYDKGLKKVEKFSF